MAQTRNTPVLRQVVIALGCSMAVREIALRRLEQYFQSDYLINAGNIECIAKAAAELRLDINEEECGIVLDHIAQQGMVNITLDHVETAINTLFDNRFIEPEN